MKHYELMSGDGGYSVFTYDRRHEDKVWFSEAPSIQAAVLEILDEEDGRGDLTLTVRRNTRPLKSQPTTEHPF